MSTAPTKYSTTIAATKTVGEMQSMLAEHGAQRIAVDYQDNVPCALTFALETQIGITRVFSLPVDIDKMHKLLIKKERQGQLRNGAKAVRSSRAQAERVAWRIMKDWLAAQITLIESEMVDLTEIMLPYVRIEEGSTKTLWQSYQEQELAALVSPS